MSDVPRPFTLRIDAKRCVLCRRCLARCASVALSMAEDAAVVNEDVCLGCGACVSACRTAALALAKRGLTPRA